MEHMMSNARTIGRAVAAAAVLTALSVSVAAANDTVSFRDVLKPHGHARSKSEKLADGAACGATGPTHTLHVTMPVFEKCMRAKGWVLDHYAPDRKVRVRGTLEHYTDTRGDARGHPRGTAALHADERACKARGHGSVKQCLAGRGWQLTLVQHGPAPRVVAPRQGSWPAWVGTSSSSQSSTNLDDEMRRIDESNRTMQANSDALAASQASVAAQQAADQQQQINIINATAPIQPQ
jgi:hypothetical protein